MQLSQTHYDLFIPDSSIGDAALRRTTHLGIGAHQDDLEFMALHGILQGFQRTDRWFGGITCTDGAGSSRSGKYADFTDEEMKAIRVEEQKTAAVIGQYSFMAQLGHPSAHAKKASERSVLTEDIRQLIETAQPEVIYTHNPFDKHATHIGVFLATLDALLALPVVARPKHFYGCEVWRGLDWLPDSAKTVHDVSEQPNLAASLNGVFDSQITGGKRYDLAVEGRRLANATFFDSHSVDNANRVQYVTELSELIDSDPRDLRDFIKDHLNQFTQEINDQLNELT